MKEHFQFSFNKFFEESFHIWNFAEITAQAKRVSWNKISDNLNVMGLTNMTHVEEFPIIAS